MATAFTINKVDYANTPAAPQTWTFEYKLFSDPESAYTLISSSAAVDIAGNLAAPLTISGLIAGQLYYVRAHDNCSSPFLYFVQQIQL